MSMSMIVKLPAQEGKGEELVEVLTKVVEATSGESGTLQYVVLQDNANADTIWMYELYTDQDAINAHMGGAVFQDAFPKIGALLAGAPEFINLTPRVGKGL